MSKEYYERYIVVIMATIPLLEHYAQECGKIANTAKLFFFSFLFFWLLYRSVGKDVTQV